MQELIVDFITSLDGYGAAEGWPGWWGLQGPEYLGWLGEQPERNYTILMGANTYRLFSGFGGEGPDEEDSLFGKFFGAAIRVRVMRVAAIDDDVAFFKVG